LHWLVWEYCDTETTSNAADPDFVFDIDGDGPESKEIVPAVIDVDVGRAQESNL